MKIKKFITTKNPNELAHALGIETPSEIKIMEYKKKLSQLAYEAIAKSKFSVNDIVERSGVARSKVSAIKNGALVGISCDLFLKVIAATGAKISFKMGM